jgi:hypothetical protein
MWIDIIVVNHNFGNHYFTNTNFDRSISFINILLNPF